jgi:DNA-binding MarR family transcriptional regulator
VNTFFTRAEANAWGGLLSVHSRLNRRLEESLRRRSGLSHAEYEVLLRLFHSEGGRLRIQTLAEDSLLTHSGMSRLVDRLEGTGLVARTEAPEDGRGAYVVLTEDGRTHFEEAASQHTALVRELFLSHFKEPELNTMSSFWKRLEEL